MKGFSFSATIEGLSRLLENLRKKANQSKDKDQGSFTVGYAAPYATFVHENLEAHHPVGSAKFLERPAREMQGELISQITTDARSGLGIRVATENAAKRLLQLSQQMVPVDTSTLKESGYVRDESDKIVAGSDMTGDEALAYRQLILQQRKNNPT